MEVKNEQKYQTTVSRMNQRNQTNIHQVQQKAHHTEIKQCQRFTNKINRENNLNILF